MKHPLLITIFVLATTLAAHAELRRAQLKIFGMD